MNNLNKTKLENILFKKYDQINIHSSRKREYFEYELSNLGFIYHPREKIFNKIRKKIKTKNYSCAIIENSSGSKNSYYCSGFYYS